MKRGCLKKDEYAVLTIDEKQATFLFSQPFLFRLCNKVLSPTTCIQNNKKNFKNIKFS